MCYNTVKEPRLVRILVRVFDSFRDDDDGGDVLVAVELVVGGGMVPTRDGRSL